MFESANPAISVIIPCYNVERWMVSCLDSVTAALPAAAEVLLVDDGSADGTLALLRARAAADGRFRVLALPHRGVSAARNAGLSAARGDLVFFVDPDDEVAPEFFSALIAEMERTQADYCISAINGPLKGDCRLLSATDIRTKFLPRIFGYSLDDVRAWHRGVQLFAHREMASVCRAAFRRELIVRHGLHFDEKIVLFEDAMFTADYLVHATSMTGLDRELYHVRPRASGAMRMVPRDAQTYCRNKLALLRHREELNAAVGGTLAPLYAASGVFSLLEIVRTMLLGRLPLAEGRRIFRAYRSVPSVRAALRSCPLAWRHPLFSLGVLCLRY